MNLLKQIPSIQEIKEYYPEYLKAHQNVWNRRLHVIGNIWTVFWLVASVWLTIITQGFLFFLIFLTPFVIYPIVWPSHKYIEKNKAATLVIKKPLLTKACDWIMMKDILLGKLPS